MSGRVCRYVVVLFLMNSVWSQGQSSLILSSNEVYVGESVSLAVSFQPYVFVNARIDAFNGTQQRGFLWFSLLPGVNYTETGVFVGRIISKTWPFPSGTTTINVTMNATLSLALTYNSTVTGYDGSSNSILTGSSTLDVFVYPETPKLSPSPLIFNGTGNATITCSARNGIPAANMSLTVMASSPSMPPVSSSGIETAAVPLSLNASWHNAVATCCVKNFRQSICTVDLVKVNDITIISIPDLSCTHESDVLLNCSVHVRSYPGAFYQWTVPPEANISDSLYLASLIVQKGQSGSFSCRATNNVTMASVGVVFTVSNTLCLTATVIATASSTGCEQCWIIGVVFGLMAVIAVAVTVGVLYKRGHFSKGMSRPSIQEQHSGVNVKERTDATNFAQHSADREYESLDTEKTLCEPSYAQLVVEHNLNSTGVYENFHSAKK